MLIVIGTVLAGVLAAPAATAVEPDTPAGAAGFATQLPSVVYGDADFTVAQEYNSRNAEVMAGIYGADQQSSFDLDGLPGTNTAGAGTAYSGTTGPRVTLIANSGIGHAWPAGGGPGGSYISTNSIAYPRYATGFFFENNRRVDRGTDRPAGLDSVMCHSSWECVRGDAKRGQPSAVTARDATESPLPYVVQREDIASRLELRVAS